MDPYEVVLYPLMGEKATAKRERENKLTFAVSGKATKNQIKEAVEKLYLVKVVSVSVINTHEGVKKAHVKLSEKNSAEEIASQFGVV
jgi:large subunit ribosomal protein L23